VLLLLLLRGRTMATRRCMWSLARGCGVLPARRRFREGSQSYYTLLLLLIVREGGRKDAEDGVECFCFFCVICLDLPWIGWRWGGKLGTGTIVTFYEFWCELWYLHIFAYWVICKFLGIYEIYRPLFFLLLLNLSLWAILKASRW